MSTFGLYLHIPFCVKKCNYCDFLSFPAKEALKDEYVSTCYGNAALERQGIK